MIVLGTVLLGPGSEKSVSDAIKSVSKDVDGFILIESGGKEAALQAALSTIHECELPATIREFTWVGDYGAARQAALDFARHIEGGCDYALTVDPDERVALPGNWRQLLESHPNVVTWMVADRDEGYYKERIIRCKGDHKWVGRVCENIRGVGADQTVQSARMSGHFWELPKDNEALDRRHQRGVIECKRMIDEGDDRFKWWRHMGSCLVGLGRAEEALEAFREADKRPHSVEEGCWNRYLICEQLVLAGKLEEAKQTAALGLADHAGFIPEFGWILCYTAFKAKDYQNASRWAQLVIQCPSDRTRVGFRGKNCFTGAKQTLEIIHKAEQSQLLVHDVVIPLTDKISDKIKQHMKAGSYEANEVVALNNILRPGDRVLELGTGCGLLATLAAKVVGSESVLTVEANPEMQGTILNVFAANNVNPKLIISAVSGDGSGRQLEKSNDFWSSQTKPGEGPSVSLQALLSQHSPTVMVCDIEGAEGELCSTALPNCLRAAIVETHSRDLDQKVNQWMNSNGLHKNSKTGNVVVFVRS